MASYKGINFAKGYNRSFADFKKEFESTHVFKNIPHLDRDSELKKAYKIATDNGNNLPTSRKSTKSEAKQDKK